MTYKRQKMKYKLDAIDKKILIKLQSDSCTNLELSKHIGLTPPCSLRRVNNLKKIKIITGSKTEINYKDLGFNFVAYLIVFLAQNDNDVRKIFEIQAQEWSVVRECHVLSGSADYLLKIVARDFEEYQTFVSSQINSLSIVAQVKTNLVVSSPKCLIGGPLELLEVNGES